MRTLFLCGASNPEGVRLALTVNRHSFRWDSIVLLDDDPSKKGRDVLGVPIVGSLDALRDASPEDEVGNLIARKTSTRAKVRERILGMGRRLVPLVHPGVDRLGVELANDVTIYPQATLGAGSRLGSGCVVFMNGTVGHGASMGECCVVAAGGVLNARVVLGDRVYVGTNAAILPDVTIGDDVTIGACSAALFDVPEGATVIGVPGEVLRPPRREEEVTVMRARATVEVITIRDEDDEPDEVRACLELAWSDVLGHLPRPNEHFFDAGGTSGLAFDLCARLGELGLPLAVADVFREPRLDALARLLQVRVGAPTPPRVTAPSSDPLAEVRARAERRARTRGVRSA
ncbi:MAG: hypothetical protein H6720_19015 [Sandaracinus sp.]|jgi:acetyltransferase-like isoleucine patch superfamily enzyme|nr:hypothetical protein [Sandaracinus sp.]